MSRAVTAFFVGSLAFTTVTAAAQNTMPGRSARVEGHLVKPAQVPFSPSVVEELRVPRGFRVNVFASGLEHARWMVPAPDGGLYLSRPKQNDVLLLRDADGDGKAEERRTVVAGLKEVHGMALHGGRIYLAMPREIVAADLRPDGTAGATRKIADLPDGGQHPNRTMAFGPDGMLYVTVGSTCNNCREPNPEHATVLVMNAEGGNRKVFAKGLRNTLGFGWHPTTKELWGMDHGSDWHGDNWPPEEVNRIEADADYGWPYCADRAEPDRYSNAEPEGTTKEAYCRGTRSPVLTYQAHSAPLGWAFYTGSAFPPDFQGDAFVAMRGSWNRQPPTGYKVVRLRFKDGKPTGFEDFLTGFLRRRGSKGEHQHLGRLCGVAVAKDGSLLISEDTNGVIYRVSYAERSAAQ